MPFPHHAMPCNAIARLSKSVAIRFCPLLFLSRSHATLRFAMPSQGYSSISAALPRVAEPLHSKPILCLRLAQLA